MVKILDLQKYVQNGTLQFRAVPHSSRQELVEENGQLKVYLHSLPEKDKANLELIKFFKKEYGLRVKIVSGMTGREKVVRIM